MQKIRSFHALGLVFIGILAAPAGAATLVREADLPQLVAESRRAALVEVTDVRYGFDDRKLHSTWVSLRVDEALYGDALPDEGAELTIKLYGAPQVMPDGSRLFIDGTPRYEPGQRYLLLLNEQSVWGFTTAAGLYQGAFRVVEDAAGRHVALDASTARSLFEEGGLPAVGGAVPYGALREAILDEWTARGGRVRASGRGDGR